MYFRALVSLNCREQKKLAPRIYCKLALFPSSKCSATVYAIVDLPAPAWPVNQKTGELFDEESSAHS